jgi:hypothetical protein
MVRTTAATFKEVGREYDSTQRIAPKSLATTRRQRGSVAEIMASLGTVHIVEAYPLRVLVVQDFDGVAAEDGNDLAGRVRPEYGWEEGNEEPQSGYRVNQQFASKEASNHHPIGF